MASIGIHPRGKLSFPSSVDRSNSLSSANPNPNLPVFNRSRKFPRQALCASIVESNPVAASPPAELGKEDDDPNNGVFLEKIDSWMRDSVEDIVKNLKQAPLLVQIYSSSENGRVRVQTEKAAIERWPEVKLQWKTGEAKSPDGLILVDELDENPDQEGEGDHGVTRAWGLVVQGKGVECGPACYLLKTDRVCGGMGLGFCTHFCLMRVNNFRDSAFEQFRDSWLLQ